MSTQHDNIADEMPVVPSNTPIAPIALDDDEYAKLFDEFEAHNKLIISQVNAFSRLGNDSERLYSSLECIKMLTALNSKLLNLLIEMNNVFSK